MVRLVLDNTTSVDYTIFRILGTLHLVAVAHGVYLSVFLGGDRASDLCLS